MSDADEIQYARILQPRSERFLGEVTAHRARHGRRILEARRAAIGEGKRPARLTVAEIDLVRDALGEE